MYIYHKMNIWYGNLSLTTPLMVGLLLIYFAQGLCHCQDNWQQCKLAPAFCQHCQYVGV